MNVIRNKCVSSNVGVRLMRGGGGWGRREWVTSQQWRDGGREGQDSLVQRYSIAGLNHNNNFLHIWRQAPRGPVIYLTSLLLFILQGRLMIRVPSVSTWVMKRHLAGRCGGDHTNATHATNQHHKTKHKILTHHVNVSKIQDVIACNSEL